MRVQDVMTHRVQTVSASTTAEDAWALMRLKRIHHLVVTEGHEIVGTVARIVTTANLRDLLGRGAEADPDRHPAYAVGSRTASQTSSGRRRLVDDTSAADGQARLRRHPHSRTRVRRVTSVLTRPCV
jgi:CBS domain-containing protein